MQSNSNGIEISESTISQIANLSPAKEKKTPPKPPKRVSFDLKYRHIEVKSNITSESFSSDNPFNSSNFITKETTRLSDNLTIENSRIVINKNKVSEGVEQPTLENKLHSNSNEISSEIDKVIDKTTKTNDTGQPQVDNIIRANAKDKENPEVLKQSTSERLRQEFVNSNDTSTKSNALAWSNIRQARSSVDSNSSLKSPTPDLQNRLSETQCKIAKLQQSLPTKLSEATVESLKSKYSPASYGYPKNFAKPPNEPSRIPSFASRIAQPKPVIVPGDESKSENNENKIKEGTIEVSQTDGNTSSNILKPENTITLGRKHTFRTELYIAPNSEQKQDNNETVDVTDNIATKNEKDAEISTIVQTTIISNKESSYPDKEQIDVKQVKDQTIESIVRTEDTSDVSSDTLTESEDSQNIKYRSKLLSLENSASKIADAENNNLTDVDDQETSSYTSETTYSEDNEEEKQPEESGMEDAKKKTQKKRSNSFKKIFGFGSKDKKKNEEPKISTKGNSNGIKKNENMLSDNAQNEAHVFDRNASQRHTISGHYTSKDWERRPGTTKENTVCDPYYLNSRDKHSSQYQHEQFSSSNRGTNSSLPVPAPRQSSSVQNPQGSRIEDRLNKIQFDLYLAQQTNQQLNCNLGGNDLPQKNIDEYVCMDNNDKSNRTDLTQPGFINAHSIDKYIDTTSSSSISTLESDTRNVIYENTTKPSKTTNIPITKIPVPSSLSPDKNISKESSPSIGEKFYERPKFANSPEIFTTTPRRTQGPQLIKPKAIIPITSERALPNPYRNIKDSQQLTAVNAQYRENVYGNLSAIETSKPLDSNLNVNHKQFPNKDTVYGKPIPPSTRNIPGNDSTYSNVPKVETTVNILEDDYGTVYDSLTPVGAQLIISKPAIINGEKNMEKRSRSVSPSQRHKAVNLSSSQSFNHKMKPPINQVAPVSPSRKELEVSKLHLPAKRETSKLRLKSPVDERRIQTKKIIDVNKKENKNNIPSHQNLQIQIDYPDNNLNEIKDRKETPQKFVFSSNENSAISPNRASSLKRSPHVSPNRPKSFTHSTPKNQVSDCLSSDTGYSEISRGTAIRSPVMIRTDSSVSASSTHSISSPLNKSKKPVTTEDLKDLKNTEVYFWEQTTHQSAKKEDNSPDQSPQQVLTQATIHQPKSSPKRLESVASNNASNLFVEQQTQSKPPVSPQKAQNLQNVEAFYWQHIKKLKEKEEHEIYNQHLQMMARKNPIQIPQPYVQHRSRSLSDPYRNAQRRSSSLPRDARPPSNSRTGNDSYARPGRQYPIPEGREVVDSNSRPSRMQRTPDYGVVRQSLPLQNNNFVRGSPQRRTVGPINVQKHSQSSDLIYENYFPGVVLRHQAKSSPTNSLCPPIFKKGSLLAEQASQDNFPQNNKKVSFSSARSDEGQIWPTKNGFTQSPPTRRVDRKAESMDDEVFLPSNISENIPIQYDPRNPVVINYNISKEPEYISNQLPPTIILSKEPIYPVQRNPIYGQNPGQREPIYGQNPVQREPTYAQNPVQREPTYIQNPGQREPIYAQNPVQREATYSQNPGQREPIYGQNLVQREPLCGPNPGQREPIYGQNPAQREAVYGRTSTGKQITVSNKVCDMYGQIHEIPSSPSKMYGNIQKTGVIYGQLQPNPVPGSPLSFCTQGLNRSDPSFVRGTRLTASFNDMRSEPPRRPLPPIPGPDSPLQKVYGRINPHMSESESGSEAGEVQRILAQKERRRQEEEWNSDSKSGRSQSGADSGLGGGRGGDNDGEVRGSRSARSGRRDDPRRHTLSGSDPHYPGGMAVQGGPLSRTMDLEMPMPRGYPPPSSAMLFDDDPGIMSEVETSSTGFRRGGKQRSSLPVVRTPSKTLERPLGLVFLQYRNETKRALLPNEITSIDTVKALFVRSFPKQLTMEYLDSPLVKIYIHDSSKDMFYELEDLRSHLRDIRDRSVLRLFESADVSGGLPGPGTGISGGIGHFEDQSYFSEPEFDSEYQHQHIHKSKTSGAKGAPPYYMGSTTLPRGGPLLRSYSPAIGGPIPADRLKTLPSDRIHTDGYMSSPERGSRAQYEDPYYSQYATRSGSITPVIDEEASDTELLDESYSLYGVKLPPPGGPRAVPAPRTQFPSAPTAVPYDATRLRVENMERQLANLTGLVQKALHQNPTATREFLQVPSGRDNYRTDKSVSFEKSVSFSDEPPDMNSPKQHSPQHTERDRLKPAPPPKPASLSPAQYDNSRHIYRDLQLTPEMYNQLRGLQKKAKDLRTEVRNLRRLSQAQAHSVRETIRDTFIKIRAMLLASGEQVWQAGIDQEKLRLSREEDLYKQEMIRLEKDLTELESTVEELRGNVINRKTRVNMSDVENMALILSKSSKTVADLKLRFPGLQDAMKNLLSSEMEKVVREEKFLKEEPERLETALRRCKKLTGTLVTLKRLASVQEQRLPNSTSDGRLSPSLTETPPITPPSAQHSKPPAVPSPRTVLGQSLVGGESSSSGSCDSSQRPENALDALLDELQTFSKPLPVNATSAPSTVTTQLSQAASYKVTGTSTATPSMAEIGRKGSMDSATLLPVQNLTVSTATGSLRRLHSYPSGSDTDNSPPIQPLQRMDSRSSSAGANKPPIPERNAELLQHLASGRRVPPPPPPRTSSKSPLASPTSPSLPPRSTPNPNTLQHIQNVQNMTEKPQSQFETATQNLGLGTLRRNVPGRSSLKEKSQTLPRNIGSNLQVQMNSDAPENKINLMSTSNSSSCESVNSQEGAKKGSRKEELEHRHQELLKKQKALQEQYARLQQLQRGNNTLTVVPPAPDLLLKKTGSESNLLQKMGLQMAAPQQMSGSLTHLANASLSTVQQATGNAQTNDNGLTASPSSNTTTSKVYETDIL